MINHLTDDEVRTIELNIGWFFQRKELLETALTHKSAGTPHNARLEKLGDAVLRLAQTEWFYKDEWCENITEACEEIENNATLHATAENLGLLKYYRINLECPSHRSSNGKGAQKHGANVLEAVVGAVYEDNRFDIHTFSVWYIRFLHAHLLRERGIDYVSRLKRLVEKFKTFDVHYALEYHDTPGPMGQWWCSVHLKPTTDPPLKVLSDELFHDTNQHISKQKAKQLSAGSMLNMITMEHRIEEFQK